MKDPQPIKIKIAKQTPTQEIPSTEVPTLSNTEAFLKAVEVKTTNPALLRLLKACRNNDPASSLESELKTILIEIIHEN